MNGCYALVLKVAESRELTVSNLGTFSFEPGYYLYFGSALNGLEARVRRHLKPAKKLHWHIDYLTTALSVIEVWWAQGDTRQECSWTQSAMKHPEATSPIKGFGSSDCRRCISHLAYLPGKEPVEDVLHSIKLESPAQIERLIPSNSGFTS